MVVRSRVVAVTIRVFMLVMVVFARSILFLDVPVRVSLVMIFIYLAAVVTERRILRCLLRPDPRNGHSSTAEAKDRNDHHRRSYFSVHHTGSPLVAVIVCFRAASLFGRPTAATRPWR
jgi:hypothetical protein